MREIISYSFCVPRICAESISRTLSKLVNGMRIIVKIKFIFVRDNGNIYFTVNIPFPITVLIIFQYFHIVSFQCSHST